MIWFWLFFSPIVVGTIYAVIIMLALAPASTCPEERKQRLKDIQARLTELERLKAENDQDDKQHH